MRPDPERGREDAPTGLTVIVLKTADQKSKLMRVWRPGRAAASGLGLNSTMSTVGRAGFVRCCHGCVAKS